jgi:hypothetical protein
MTHTTYMTHHTFVACNIYVWSMFGVYNTYEAYRYTILVKIFFTTKFTVFSLEEELGQFRSIQEREGPLKFLRELVARAEKRTAEIGDQLMNQQLTDNIIQNLKTDTGNTFGICLESHRLKLKLKHALGTTGF